MKIRRSRKLAKFSIEMPEILKDNIDYLADQTQTSRSDAIREILEAVMENGDLLDMIFGEALEENADDDNEDEEEEESEEEGESETEASNEDQSEDE
jgi:predicted DNA-binding protein